MYKFPIGVMVDSFNVSVREGIKKAAAMGADGIQVYAVSGAMDPDNLSKKDRQELLDFIKAQGLAVAAICGDLGGHGFAAAEDNDWKIEKSKKIVELACDLESDVVTTHIGVIPDDKDHSRYQIMQETCEKLGEIGDEYGISFAIETGPETCTTLKEFLDSLNSEGMKVNYDPANLVMVTGDDPAAGVYTLKDYIVHTHAKDGVMLKKSDPETIYNYFAEGGIEDMRLEDYFQEKPLGEGDVDFNEYLQALDDINYSGFLTIEREVGDNPARDIEKAVNFLQGLIQNK